MTLGTMPAYWGIGFVIGSFSALALVFLGGGALLHYCGYIEEKELDARFGAGYPERKRTTPFPIPRWKREKIILNPPSNLPAR